VTRRWRGCGTNQAVLFDSAEPSAQPGQSSNTEFAIPNPDDVDRAAGRVRVSSQDDIDRFRIEIHSTIAMQMVTMIH
jgi:hypothetical protein